MNRLQSGLIRTFDGVTPTLHESVFLAETAVVIGNVEVGARSTIWYGAVLRGDVNVIRIGEETSIQDNSVIHVTEHKSNTHVGSRVTVGHNVILHGCTIGDTCIIGMGSIVLDHAEVGDRCFIGAGSLVTSATKIPSGWMAMGSPARPTRLLRPDELEWLAGSAQHYVDIAARYLK